jgi:hypothetical protein
MFDRSVTAKDSLEEGFRIFARNTSTKLKPANRPKNTVGLNAVWAHLTAFTAGACINPSTAKAVRRRWLGGRVGARGCGPRVQCKRL